MAEINVAVLIYRGIEVIDMNGPIDVFIKANRLSKKNIYRVFTVAESAGEIQSELSAVRIIPEYTLTNCPKPDIIVIPGQIMAGGPKPFGIGSDELRTWIKEHGQDSGITIMSVCVGVYILAKTGLLANKQATTHWKTIQNIQQDYSNIRFIKNVRFVQDGNIISTGGVTSGIDGALHLIEKMDSPEVANGVANMMVYNREAPLPAGTILP
jgi:transcriptional regulator GlxA family with amidase domain